MKFPDASGVPANMLPISDATAFVDCRPRFFSNHYSVSPGTLSRIPGKGAVYVIAFTDIDGVPLSGATNYELTDSL